VLLEDIERNLDLKGLKITRRKGDAKPKFLEKEEPKKEQSKPLPKAPVEEESEDERILMGVVDTTTASPEEVERVLRRPVQKTADIMKLVNPIIESVRAKGDEALLELTSKFDGVKLASPVLKAPFDPKLYEITQELKDAIDLSIENVYKFHKAQLQTDTLRVETQPGVICSRFSRPIEKVGLYVPGGTAVLPSTAIMLGVPAQVAGSKEIVIATPPRKDGSISPEVVYVANKVGATTIVLAGGAQAVASMAYGTESVPKVDKILGPGNQFVTAAKMYIQNDTTALCSIDMPAGPSEVLVVADGKADPDFVASDLLSQAEHGVDSQVILIGVNLSKDELKAIEDAIHEQALKLPRVDIVRKCIKHSTTLLVKTHEDAIKLSNQYAPEHLILQVEDAASYVDAVQHAGSVFVGAYSPESLGDYSSGTNHTLPTYGYARMYSGVNTATFQKFLTSQDVTPEGLKNIGHAVMSVAKVEGLDAHRNAVKIRMEKLGLLPENFV
jgi:phosphoribosyl-ATP pyrophosphohydrolase/phosphoribosyl-AMP cyclohydrolase/histidinol dehydrogenase